MPRSTRRLAPFLLVTTLIAGCLDDGPGVTGPEAPASAKGVTLLLTDAPGDFTAAVVTIAEIYLQGDNGRTVLLDQPFTTDLLTLKDAYATIVQGVSVPPGSYAQLRAVVSGAYIEVETASGTRIFASSPDYPGLPAGAQVDGTLQMPSWGSSGLKIEMPGGKLEVSEGQTIVLIDFDVEDSFGHEAGNSGRWVMSPRVTATNVTFGGSALARLQLASGVVLPGVGGQPITLGSFAARLTPVGGGTAKQMQLTDVNADGVYEAMIPGLIPGDYTLDFVVPAGLILTFDPVLPRTLTVVSSQTTTETVTITSAQLAGSIVASLSLASGVVLPTLNGAAVTLAAFKAALAPAAGGAVVEVAFSDTNGDGVFEAVFADLPAGAYSLTVLAPAGITATLNPVPPVTVTLAAGATETRPFVVTAAVAS